MLIKKKKKINLIVNYILKHFLLFVICYLLFVILLFVLPLTDRSHNPDPRFHFLSSRPLPAAEC
jgi:hypothetical protein